MRLIEYKVPASGKTLKFLTNLPREGSGNQKGYSAETVARLYKMRWSRLRQEDSPYKVGRVEFQIWVVMIANLIFHVVHKQVKECECFTAIVSMAGANMLSRLRFQWAICQTVSSAQSEKLRKKQLELFGPGGRIRRGGMFWKNLKKPPVAGNGLFFGT